jgi:hypothetical protein
VRYSLQHDAIDIQDTLMCIYASYKSAGNAKKLLFHNQTTATVMWVTPGLQKQSNLKREVCTLDTMRHTLKSCKKMEAATMITLITNLKSGAPIQASPAVQTLDKDEDEFVDLDNTTVSPARVPAARPVQQLILSKQPPVVPLIPMGPPPQVINTTSLVPKPVAPPSTTFFPPETVQGMAMHHCYAFGDKNKMVEFMQGTFKMQENTFVVTETAKVEQIKEAREFETRKRKADEELDNRKRKADELKNLMLIAKEMGLDDEFEKLKKRLFAS